jgi:hypothetical protein
MGPPAREFGESNSRPLSSAIAVASAIRHRSFTTVQILLDVPPDQSDECRGAVTTAKGRMKLMTTQEQDQPTAASEPAESRKARAAARKAPAGTTQAKSAQKPGRGKKAPKRRPKSATPGQSSKGAHVIALLKKAKGATLAELMKSTGWQAHSVRGFLSGTLRKRMGLKVESAKRADGERVYSIIR